MKDLKPHLYALLATAIFLYGIFHVIPQHLGGGVTPVSTTRFKNGNTDRYFLFDTDVVAKVIPNEAAGTATVYLKNGKSIVLPFSWATVDSFETSVKSVSDYQALIK